MFRRQIPHDGDVVAAARRRLEALAAHHTPDHQHLDEPLAAPTEVPVAEPVDALPGSGHRGPPAARHLGERRSELGRWGVTAQHVTVLALGLLLLVILVAWWALRSVPHAEQVSLTSHRQVPEVTLSAPESRSPATPTLGQPGSTATVVGAGAPGSGRLVVDVAGRVRRPGIVELDSGSRVVDAIDAAGGALPGVSLTSLNLARLLVDGEQIVVGLRVPGFGGGLPPAGAGSPTGGGSPGSGSGTSTSPAIQPVPLNTATSDQLDTLPGIGPVTAQAILQWRADNGPFTSVDELLEVSGIGDATLGDIRPYVYV